MPGSSNRFTRFDPQQYVSSYIPLPFEEIMAVGSMKQNKQDIAQADLAKLDAGVKSLNSLPGDREYAQKGIQNIHNNIDQFTTMDFNDPSVRANWNKTKSQITQRFMPTGDLGMIDMNYKLYSDWNKDFLDSGQKAGWGTDKLQGFSNQKANTFTTFDEQGNQRMFQGEGVANRVDYNKWIHDSLGDVAADTGNMGLVRYGSLDEINTAYQSGSIEHKDYQKIMNALALRAQGDAALVQSLEQEGKFNGQEGWGNFIQGQDKNGNVIVDTTNPFGLMLSGAASGAQYRKTDTKYNIVGDPLAEHRAKKAIDEEGIKPGAAITLGNITTTAINPYEKYKANIKTGTNLLGNTVSTKFTKEQDAMYNQAILAFGMDSKTNRTIEEKANILNKYIDTKGAFNSNPTINLHGSSDPIETDKFIRANDRVLFGDKTNTAGQATQRQFKLIEGDVETAEGSGSEVLHKYADPKKYKVTSIGTLTPDNPYFAAGEIVTVTDLDSGEKVATYAMAGTNQEQAAQSQENSAYSAKYNESGISKVSFPTTDGTTQQFEIKWVPRIATIENGLIKSGDPDNSNNSKISEQLIVTPLDSNGKPIEGQEQSYQSNVNDEFGGDVISMWYSDMFNQGQK